MPVDRCLARGFRMPGVYAGMLAHQEAAAVSVDTRLLDLSLTDPEQMAADRAAVAATTRPTSVLLTKLRAAVPVTVEWSMLRTTPHWVPWPPDRPEWLRAPGSYVRVTPDDRLEPSDGPPDSRLHMMG